LNLLSCVFVKNYFILCLIFFSQVFLYKIPCFYLNVMSIVKSLWFCWLNMQRHTKICFPPKNLMKDHIPSLFIKTLDTNLLPIIITNYATINVIFDLWIKMIWFFIFSFNCQFLKHPTLRKQHLQILHDLF
jgi:hypothetical protein